MRTRLGSRVAAFVALLSSLAATACSDGDAGPAGHSDDAGPAGHSDDAGTQGEEDAASAPPLDRTIPSGFADAFAFLYDGPTASQRDVEPNAIDPQRMAVVRGRVLDASAEPLEGVRIAVIGAADLGYTRTRADGSFDLVVNGGSKVRVSFDAAGYLPLERGLEPEWNTFERPRDVFLTKLDPTVTEVTLGEGEPLQVAVGSAVSDRSGSRTAALLFGSGTTATMILPDGTEKELTTAHVRATEYTVGDNGPKAMPAALPPQSGYTYAVELTIDEAQAAGAQEVKFSKPVPYYVENFLRFPVGEPVPSGYFDRQRGEWVSSESGRVVEVLTVTGGRATLDIDGDGNADDAAALAALGIDDEELAVLAKRHAAGSSLWRVPLSHFSTWDFNWCFFGRLFDALSDLFDGTAPLSDSCRASGSIIECENQILGESVRLVGVPYGLHYRSDRAPGRRDAYHFEVQLTGASAPPGAKRVRFELDVLGQHVSHAAEATANQRYEFDWDGRDAYGRRWQGPATARYRVGYVYDGWYSHTPVFGAYGEIDRKRWNRAPDDNQAQPPGITAEDDLARLETTMWLPWQSTTLGTFDASALGFGGMTLGVHHTYDAASHTLYLGTGERRQATSATRAVRAMLGETSSQAGERGDARHTPISGPHGLAVAGDGAVYVAAELQHQVLRVERDGRTSVVAGTGVEGFSGDGGPATAAQLDRPLGLALASDGTLYIAERINRVIRRVHPDGTIDVFAGGGTASDDGAPKPALDAVFGEPHAVALGLDGSLFIADAQRHNIRRVRTDGVIETVVGSGEGLAGDTGDGGPGTKALLNNPLAVAVGPDGSLYIAEFEGHRIRRMTPDGSVMTVAGTGSAGNDGDGGLATAAHLNQPHTVDVGPDGTLYISDEGNDLIRQVTTDGIIQTIAGGGDATATDFTPALDVSFSLPRIAMVEPDGDLLVADYEGNFVYRVLPFLPSSTPEGAIIASDDGGAYYEFDRSGRHLKTVDALTGVSLWTFAYDAAGRLSRVSDVHGQELVIARDASTGHVSSLRAPSGLTSWPTFDANGWLEGLKDPADEQYTFGFSEDGLLLSSTSPAGREHTFSYDDRGRLTRDTEASGSFQSLTPSDDGATVVRKNALGHTYTYDRSVVDGVPTRTVTAPDKRKQVMKRDGSHTTTTMADGSSLRTERKADPRFGMQSAYVSKIALTTPDGVSASLERNRDITLSGPEDSNTLKTLRETVTLDRRNIQQTTYDIANRTLTKSTRGDTVRMTFDELGQPVTLEPAGTAPINIEYDDKGRVTKVAQGTRVESRTYDVYGYLASAVDAAGNVWTFENDALGNVLSVSAAAELLYSRAFDTGDELAAISLADGAEHAFRYDRGGRLSRYVAPSVQGQQSTVSYVYAADDALDSMTAPSGKRVRLVRDAAGRLTSIVTPEGTTTFAYDTQGALARAELGDEAVVFTWNGPLLTDIKAEGTVESSLMLGYDAALRLQTEKLDEHTASYTYGSNGRLSAVGEQTLTYRDAQRVSRRTHGVMYDAYTYSPDFGELTRQQSVVSGTVVYDATYQRDDLGRIIQHTEKIEGEVHESSFSYDPLGRLHTVTSDGETRTYTYDAHGNRLGNAARYDAQDRVVAYGDASFAHTLDGYLASRSGGDGTTQYEYDALGQLRSASSDERTIEYVIDPLGRRIAKKVDGALTQKFVYDVQGRIIAEHDGSGRSVSRFVYGTRGHVPDYMLRGGSTLQLVTDSRGSVRLVIDVTTGAVAQRIDYDEFGRVLSNTNPGLQPFGFAGGLYDPDTGLVRFGARDYDSYTGRWTARDPILFAGGQANLYAYVGNDPVNRIDPSGRYAWIVGGAAAGAAFDIFMQLQRNNDSLCGDGRDIDWGEVGMWALRGAAAGAGLEFLFGTAFSGLSTSGELVAVTQWGPGGSPWVMLGGNTIRNYLMSGVLELGYGVGTGVTQYVLRSQLQYPSGLEWFKALLGQRILGP